MAYPYRKLLKPSLGSRPYKGHRPTRGIVGFWPMSEKTGSQVFDVSGHENTGVITGATWQPGRVGSALLFNGGTDQIACGINVPNLTAMAFICWVKQSAGSAGFYISLGTGTKFYLKRNNDSQLRFRRVDLSDGDGQLNIGTFCDDTWHQIGCMWDSVTTYGIRDGVLYPSEAATGTMLTVGLVPYIGRIPAIATSNVGLMDLPIFYNRGLSVSEIALIYREPFCMFKRPGELAIMGGYEAPVGDNVPVKMRTYRNFRVA